MNSDCTKYISNTWNTREYSKCIKNTREYTTMRIIVGEYGRLYANLPICKIHKITRDCCLKFRFVRLLILDKFAYNSFDFIIKRVDIFVLKALQVE